MKIFCVGFPKSATKTLTRAFESVGIPAFHQNTTDGQNVSVSLDTGFRDKMDPFFYLKQRFDSFAITEADYTNFERGIVSWPQLKYDLVSATFYWNQDCVILLNYREPHSLLDSFTRWKGGEFRERITRADIPGLPAGKGIEDKDLLEWFESHFTRIRKTYSKCPDRFLEVDIQSPRFREDLEEFLDLRFEWWGKENVNNDHA